MGKYLIKGRYSNDGIKGVMDSGGTSRVEFITKMVEGLGGSIEAFYFMFGEDDIMIVIDSPEPETMIAVAGKVRAAGVLDRYETCVLLTPEQIDNAGKVEVDYTPPGG